MITYWPADDSVEFLAPVDLVVSAAVIETTGGEGHTHDVLEVGVWKGGWSLTVLRNTTAKIIGLDPYPGYQPVRARLLETVERMSLADRFRLHDTWAAVKESHPGPFDVIHVDGDHSEAGAERDLREAAAALAPNGVIIVDDIAHPYFPGIASATYRFLESAGFAIFAYSSNKAYICRAADHARRYELTRERLAQTPLIVERHFEELDAVPGPYVQLPDVVGFPMLLCVARGNGEIAWNMVAGAPPEEPELPAVEADAVPEPVQPAPRRFARAKDVAREWLPPKVHRAVARMIFRD